MKNKLSRIKDRHLIKNQALIILLVLLIVIFSITEPKFLTLLNIRNIIVQNAHLAVLSMGVAMIMISGGVDLSIGYQISMSAVIMTMLITKYGIHPAPAIVLGIIICMLTSVLNILLSMKLGGHTMIITLGTMAGFQGISYTISNASTFINLPNSFLFIGQGSILGIPVNLLVMAVVFVFTMILMEKTYIGKRIYACGDNPESARLAGIKVIKVKIGVFAMAGILTGLSAWMLSARSGSANSSSGVGMEFTGITACVLGGVSLKGGEGKVWKVLVAVYVLGVLSNGMQFVGLGTYAQYIVKCILMLFSVGLSNNAFSFKRKRTAVMQDNIKL